jgi:hypothetical protein
VMGWVWCWSCSVDDLPDSENVPNERAIDAQSSLPTARYHALQSFVVPVAVGEALAVKVGGIGRSVDAKLATQ